MEVDGGPGLIKSSLIHIDSYTENPLLTQLPSIIWKLDDDLEKKKSISLVSKCFSINTHIHT